MSRYEIMHLCHDKIEGFNTQSTKEVQIDEKARLLIDEGLLLIGQIFEYIGLSGGLNLENSIVYSK